MKKRILIQSLGLRFGANKDLSNLRHRLNTHSLLRKPTANLALGGKMCGGRAALDLGRVGSPRLPIYRMRGMHDVAGSSPAVGAKKFQANSGVP